MLSIEKKIETFNNNGYAIPKDIRIKIDKGEIYLDKFPLKNDYDKIYHVLLMNHFLKITILTKMPSEKCLVLSPLLFSFGEKSINTVR